ncbi:MAG: carbonic anhydrase family protein [Sphingomonadales bacterium]|nr:carbonic anhydrase family protein [Sphingomonadales bacterium]PIX64272.1 MAG: twin-arginine translocation pathway signal protein [Sphingomonadales bacterium CG_4_10_14_3_um_filter_58_15]NCO50025.1 carbonic anhydrase family protein [Sphingomonadales bacterium]NCO99944.1 carbonic anhydrase family protein [Sphingomonadales bacterium]NCP25924.1 carbonic anhydrase family protein [Sphingomonadales bacterium]
MTFPRISGALAVALIATSPVLANHHKSFGYGADNGSEKWGQLDDKYALCESGDMQSPIDLAGANAIGNIVLTVNYQAGPLTVANKGLTVQADFAPGSTMTSGGMTFNLIQIHFHTPSEHAISGKRYPLTGHFVHATEDGKLGVLGVMFEEGAANAELAKILSAAPEEKSDPAMVTGQSIDPNGLLPADRSVYRYMGSLTTLDL